MKLIVSVFERAKSKITSTRSTGRVASGLFETFMQKKTLFNIKYFKTLYFIYFLDSENEFDPNNSKPITSSGPFVIHQQPRLSLSKWLCTNPSSVEKSVGEIENNLYFTLHDIRQFLLILNKTKFHSNNLHPAVCILRLQI
jgi:hypothetical protein